MFMILIKKAETRWFLLRDLVLLLKPGWLAPYPAIFSALLVFPAQRTKIAPRTVISLRVGHSAQRAAELPPTMPVVAGPKFCFFQEAVTRNSQL
jgi:hypothetical protein